MTGAIKTEVELIRPDFSINMFDDKISENDGFLKTIGILNITTGIKKKSNTTLAPELTLPQKPFWDDLNPSRY